MNTLDALTRANQVPVDFTLDHLRMLRQGQQADQMNLADLARRQQHEAAMDPLRLQQAEANVAGTKATTDATMANAWRLGRDNAVRAGIPQEMEIQSKLTEMLRKAGDDELAMTLQEAQRMSFSQDPRQRLIGEMLLGQTKEALEERRKHNYRMIEIGAQGANALRVATTPRPAAPQKAIDFKNPTHLGTYYLTKANEAFEAAGNKDTPESEHFRRLADEQMRLAQQIEILRAQGRLAGTPQVPGLPTQPMPTPQGVSGATPQGPQQTQLTPAQQDWVSRAMKANPGMTQEQIIEEGRKRGKL